VRVRRRRREVPIATGRVSFDQVTNALFTWQMHRAPGITATSSREVAEAGAVIVMRLGYGPASLTAPCQVVYCVQETNARGKERG
jgi:uncharacterized protein (UPF0548 family)